MDGIQQYTTEKMSPYDQINVLNKRLTELEAYIGKERFSSKNRYIREIAIAKDGKFRIEQKDSFPSTSITGELIVVNGALFLSVATDDFMPVSAGAVRSIAAGTASDSPTAVDSLIQCNTSAGQALAITLPEAANNIGLELTFTFVNDGGQNVTITRTGSDTIDDNVDTGNTTVTLDSAGDTIILRAVQDNIWAVINNINCTLA